MITVMNSELCMLEIWLMKAETGDERIEKKIREFTGYMKTLGIGVVVFRSGRADLRECTRQLALHNYELYKKSLRENADYNDSRDLYKKSFQKNACYPEEK